MSTTDEGSVKGRARQRAVTIKDVAAHVGVSYSAVSRALSNHRHTSAELKERVLKAVGELGYEPHAGARMMHQPSSRMIGLLIPDITNQLFAAAAAALSEACRKEGFQLILSVSENDPNVEYEQLRLLRQSRVAGIIIAPCGNSLVETHRLLSTLPVVQLGRRSADLSAPTVTAADWQGAYAAIHHLAQLGHQRIAVIGGDPNILTSKARLDGAYAALAELGLERDRSLIWTGPPTGEFGRATMIRIWSQLNTPTAAFALNGAATLGMLDAIHQLRISVPAQLSVVGFGDLEWFRLWGPGLTTVDLPIKGLAEAAASLLMGQIMQEDPSADPSMELSLDANLIVRGSTAAPSH
ncbi:LacI family DNA-binding transcriptional regulator [Xanthobacter sp. AM11]|uniref:LacI family DNA-binding transcriptional regulator n=1 Tax=Xanthobacter sp. AM11 TaxID=3380643 RepID=UPI0039BF8686